MEKNLDKLTPDEMRTMLKNIKHIVEGVYSYVGNDNLDPKDFQIEAIGNEFVADTYPILNNLN